MPSHPDHPISPALLVDTEAVADAAEPVLAWFEWYATSGDQPVEPDDIRRLFAADRHLAPLARLGGPVGHAIAVILDGGIGHPTRTLLDALDTLDAFVHPDRPTADAPWHQNPRPLHRARPHPEHPAGSAYTPALPGLG